MASRRQELELVRVVAAAIEKHARGDVVALGIITELREAILRLYRAGKETTGKTQIEPGWRLHRMRGAGCRRYLANNRRRAQTGGVFGKYALPVWSLTQR